jgi:glutamate--cysteine ligase
VENKNSGYLSYRSRVWQRTARAGLPKYFLENMNFEKYADMTMKMPLLFVIKDSNYLNATGKTFKDFMEGNLSIVNNMKPTIRDFRNHLATIFTEVRLKQYIEIRSLDTCEWDCHCGGPAFYAGLLYSNLDEAYDIISKWNISEVLNAYIETPKKGLNALIENRTILEWGKIFLSLARKGLEKRSIKNDTGKDESIFLRSVESILTNEKTKAEIGIEKFKKNKNLDFLYEKKE